MKNKLFILLIIVGCNTKSPDIEGPFYMSIEFIAESDKPFTTMVFSDGMFNLEPDEFSEEVIVDNRLLLTLSSCTPTKSDLLSFTKNVSHDLCQLKITLKIRKQEKIVFLHNYSTQFKPFLTCIEDILFKNNYKNALETIRKNEQRVELLM